MKQARVYISGFVQGVGYRQFVKRNARDLGLVGWVRNLPASPDASFAESRRASQGGPDGRVEAVFQGGRKEVEKIVEICRKGPFLSEVENVIVAWEEEKEKHNTFQII